MTLTAFSMTTVGGDPGDEKLTSSTKEHPFGTRLVIGDRIFKYGQVNGAIGAGNICQNAVSEGNHNIDLAVTAAAAVGAKTVSITLGGTAAAAELYADGYLYVNDVDGEGHMYKIQQHDAIGSGGGGDINLYDGDTIAEALTTSSQVGLFKNPYSEVIVYPTTGTGASVGVASTEIADNYYGWFQITGFAPVLCDVAFIIGNHVRTSDNQAGAGEPLDRDVSAENDESIGVAAVVAPATGEYGIVDLRISA